MILAGASAASAHDDRHDERWEREHHHDWDHRDWDYHPHGPDHWHPVVHPVLREVREVYVEPPPRVVYQRPPVMMAPAPVYQAPAYQPPAYQPPVPSSMNLNFTIPLR